MKKNHCKAVVIGKNKKKIIPLVHKAGFDLVSKNPDFAISFGGDGTLMLAEHLYPGVPKIILKDSLICKKCSNISNEAVLKLVAKGSFHIEKMIKLEASIGKKTFMALNDIVVHNSNPRHAIRYHLSVDNRTIGPHIIGDGIIVATPFGSTAYYRSITDSFFEIGMGLAFNNSTEQFDHMVLGDDSVISMKIIRGPAIVYADNQEFSTTVDADDMIEIKKSKHFAQIVAPEKN